jgi:glycerate kinase
MDGQVDWLIAPDAFKGTLSAREVALALARGARDGGGEIEICPVADGGEGTLEILLRALGGRRVQTRVHDPMGRPLDASFGWVQGQSRAIVSSADASGLALVAAGELDAELASTLGTGELIAEAVAAGAPEVVVALGGSASTDGGAGAIEGIESRGGLGGARLTVLADVSTPFERAAEVFAPQKGADAAAVERLSRRLQEQAAGLPRDPRGVAMTGAAGGLAGGLWAMYGARLVPGAPWVLDTIGFDDRLRRARAVITGEGRLDSQTLAGKAVAEVARRCAAAGTPLHAVVGSCTLSAAETAQLSFASVRVATDMEQLEAAGRALVGELSRR